MIEDEQPHEVPYDPVVEAIRIFARRGRQLREAEERGSRGPEAEGVVRDAATANASYEGMTPEERGIAVYEKWEARELHFSEMTRLEQMSLESECKRQSEQTHNLLWNIEHHHYLLERVNSIEDRLTEEEQRAIIDLMESCRWGSAEVEQVKESIETAEWFSNLRPCVRDLR